MKKLLFASSLVLLTAAGCTQQLSQSTNYQAPTPVQNQISQTPPAKTASASGITGTITVTSCNGAQPSPVLQYDPCQRSVPKTFTLRIQNLNTGSVQQTVITTDSSGKFKLQLVPGKYQIQGQESVGSTTVNVLPGQFTDVALSFTEMNP